MMRDIYYGDSQKDINLCVAKTNFYRYNEVGDFSKSDAQLELVHVNENIKKNIMLNLRIL